MVKKSFYTLVFLIGSLGIYAQDIQIRASIDTNFLLIGEQTIIELKVQYHIDDEPKSVKFPVLTDTISEFIEILHSSEVDTIKREETNQGEQIQRLTITSFDSGHYEIPYFDFIIDGKSLKTGPLFINVIPMEVDTAKAIFDIKQPISEPFTFLDWLKENWIWVSIIIALIIGGIILIIYLKNKPEIIKEEVIPAIPYYIITLEKLEKLKESKLWQDGKVKLYHSEISEIMRDYIEKRYQVNALENTTDEIMQGLRFQAIHPDLITKLNQILMLADLVKFAKEKPLPNENDMSLINAVEFVKSTKIINEQTEKYLA